MKNKNSVCSGRLGWAAGLYWLCILILGPVTASAASVNLVWNRNTEADLVGYRVYRADSSGPFRKVLQTGLDPQATVGDLNVGETYHFVVTAVAASGLESKQSNRVTHTVPEEDVPVEEIPDDVNQDPIAVDASLNAVEDTDTAIQLVASDPEGEPLTYSIVLAPANGRLLGTAPSLTYRPNANYNGPDRFRFKVSDGTLESAVAEVAIQVTPVNDAPTATAQTLSLREDATLAIVLSGQDVEGSPLSYVIHRQPTGGTLVGVPPLLTYVPRPDYFGSDKFEFRVSDGQLVSQPATVMLQVEAVDDPPIAVAQGATVAANGSVAIVLSGVDPDTSVLTYRISRSPSHGTLTGKAPNVVYRPASGFSGADSFEFTVRDATQVSAPSVVSIEVLPSDGRPTATSATYTLTEDSPLGVLLVGTDPDGDDLTYTITVPPQRGKLTGNGPTLTYQPNANFAGSDWFEFTCSDGGNVSEPARISLEVTPVNDPPKALSRTIATSYGMPILVILNGNDPEDDRLTFRVVTPPEKGKLIGTPPLLIYTPRWGFVGRDSLEFVANDGDLDSEPATIQFRVSLSLFASWRSQTSISIGGNESGDGPLGDGVSGAGDAGGRPGVIQWVNLPAHGAVALTTENEITYQHSGDGAPVDAFSYIARSTEGVDELVWVGLHRVGIEALTRAGDQGEVSFSVLAGLNYRVEANDVSPAGDAPWTVLEEWVPEESGLARVPVSFPETDGSRFVRISCTVPGTGEREVSEVWGVQSTSVGAGVDGRVYGVPFQAGSVLRARVVGVESDVLELDASKLEAPDLLPREGQPTHAVVVRSSERVDRIGEWWPITGQSMFRVQVDHRAEVLSDLVQPGDEVEVLRLSSVGDVFGKAGQADVQLADGDRLSLEGFGGERYVLSYRNSNRGGAAYWVERNGQTSGPFDGTTLPLLPTQAFSFANRRTAGPVRFAGRVEVSPITQYFLPGVRMAANGFAIRAEVPELGPYRLAEGEQPWIEGGLMAEVELPPGEEGVLTSPEVPATTGVEAGGGIWIRVPDEAGMLRWTQARPW